MKPIFSRETVVDRRQPQIRWTAVLAGSVIALGLWNLFNLIFIGGALTAIDPDEIDNLHAFGIGTGIGSVLAPLIAMFVGGLVAGRLASHYDHRVTGAHGALVWAFSSVLGLAIMAIVAGSFVDHRATMGAGGMPAPGTAAYIDDQVRLMNVHLESQGAPSIKTSDLLDAARFAAGDGRTIDRDAFVSRLDANTSLSRPEAEAVLAQLGPNAPDVIFASRELALQRHQAITAAESTGNVLLAGGAALFLCLVTAMAGALIGGRILRGDGDRLRTFDRPDTIPGHPVATSADPEVRRDPLE